MTVWYIDIVTGQERTKIIPAAQDPYTGLWFVDLDTEGMADGTIRTQVTAIDVDGKSTTTTDIIYTVKNTPPQIEMTIPLLKDSDFEIWNFSSDNIPLIFVSNNIMGVATDLYGIEKGYPQIMIWPTDDNGVMLPGITLDNDNAPLSNNRRWGTWRTTIDDKDNPLEADGLKAVMFRWSTLKLIEEGSNNFRVRNSNDPYPIYPYDYFDVGRYHFKIRVKDKFGVVNVYPYRLGSGFTPEDHPNQYMAIHVAETSNPIITWADPPRIYSHQTQTPLQAEITIIAKNGVMEGAVSARVNDSLTVNFIESDKNFVTRIIGNDESARYQITIPASELEGRPSNDNMMLHVRAQDRQGNFSISSTPFVLDVTPPEIEFIQPEGLGTPQPPQVTGTVIIRGSALDNQQVDKLFYALGRTETSGTLGLTWDDHTGWTDTGLGLTTATSNPTNTHLHNVRSVWSGVLSNWSWRLEDVADFCRLPTPVSTSPVTKDHYFVNEHLPTFNLWKLPIKLKVVDRAGNVYITDIELILDPDADTPIVHISSHSDNTIVGGTVHLNGIAEDNDAIHSVEIRVTKQSDNNARNGIPLSDSPGIPVTLNSDNDNFLEVDGRGNRGPTVSWFHILNDDNDLTFDDGIREVLIEIRARDSFFMSPDSPKQYGPIKKLTLFFDPNVPVISGIEIIRGTYTEYINTPPGDREKMKEPYEGRLSTISGFVTLKVNISDDSNITSIRLRNWNRADNVWIDNYMNNIGFTSNETPFVIRHEKLNPADRQRYTMYIPLDTNSDFRAGFFKNQANIFSMDIEAEDNASPLPYRAQSTITLQVDNFFPTAEFTSNPNFVGITEIEGESWDTGTGINVFEVNRVVLYFSKPDGSDFGTLVNLRNSNNSDWHITPNANEGERVRINRRSTVSGVIGANPAAIEANQGRDVRLPFFPVITRTEVAGQVEYSSNAGIVIYKNDNVDGRQQFFGSGNNRTWSVNFDSTELPDGRYYLNYVVYDSAGNASWFKEEITVRNKTPVITGIDLKADLIGDPANLNWVNYTVPLPNRDTSFTSRNERLGFEIKTREGASNGTLNYRVSYITGTSTDTILVTELKPGVLYQIADLGRYTNWTHVGASSNPSVGEIFIATGEAKTRMNLPLEVPTGTVRRIEYDEASTQRTRIGTNTLYFTEDDFATGGIPESLSSTTNDRRFFVKVFDTMISGAKEAEQLSDFRIVNLTVRNIDTEPPTISVAPFGQRYILRTGPGTPLWENDEDKVLSPEDSPTFNYNENIVMSSTGNVRQGYVQYARHSGPSEPAHISGQVIFRGKAHDNQRIQNITVTIPGYDGDADGGAFTVATFDTADGKLVSNRPVFGNAVTERWYFNVYHENLTLAHGHTVNWEFGWDSSYVTNQVSASTGIIFTVNDREEDPLFEEASITVSIVPYITEIVTELSGAYRAEPSVYARSSRGWYPVRENEVITIRGFNLGVGASTGSIGNNTTDTIVNVGGLVTSNTTAITGGTNLAVTMGPTRDQLTANIGTAAMSGDLTVRVSAAGTDNAVNSINNRARVLNVGVTDTIDNRLDEANRVAYNWEPNNVNNNILTNDRKLYIWSVGNILTNPPGVSDPVMRVSPSGSRLLTLSAMQPQGRLRVYNDYIGVNAADAELVIGETINRFLNIGAAIDSANDWFVVASNTTGNQSNWVFLNARAAATSAANRNSTTAAPNKSPIIYQGNDNLYPDIVRIPRLHSRNANTSTRLSMVVLSYGNDSTTYKNIVLHYGTVTGTNSATFGGNFSTTTSGTTTRTSDGGISPSTRQEVTTATSDHRGSMYTAVATLSNGQPVIAWHDERAGHENLLFSYGNTSGASSISTTSTTAWQNRTVVIHGNTANHRGYRPSGSAGIYVDMAVDAADNVHLAYYDMANGGLYYAHITGTGIPNAATDSTTTRVSNENIKVVRVDTFPSAGLNLMINVRTENGRHVPYISYFNGSVANTRNSVRVAWPVVNVADTDTDDLQGTDDRDFFRGTWEVMTVPAVKVALSDNFISNGVPATATSWRQPAGLTWPADATGIDRSIIVGYLTNTRYEGATLKHVLW